MIRLLFLLITGFGLLYSEEGTVVNPLTDICWECMFPITVSSVNTTPEYKDYTDYDAIYCICPGVPPRPGVPITFWEPTKLIDVTHHAYKLIGLGGVSIGTESIKNRGCLSTHQSGTKSSFAHVHIYDYPVFTILDILTDFTCVEKGSWDLSYFSELDYTWYDDSLTNILNPEAALFANPLAQAACIADCASSTFYRPTDSLFWCAGCHGSLYPFTGFVGSHVGGIQSSQLLLQRGLAKMHKTGFIRGYEKDNFCEATYMPIIKKTLYKTQLAHPVADTNNGCHALGETDVLWGSCKSYPFGGEDFVYILWQKKHCCLDAAEIAELMIGGGG